MNSDSTMFGGSGMCNDGVIRPQMVSMHGRNASVVLRLPGNGGLILKPEFRDRKKIAPENKVREDGKGDAK